METIHLAAIFEVSTFVEFFQAVRVNEPGTKLLSVRVYIKRHIKQLARKDLLKNFVFDCFRIYQFYNQSFLVSSLHRRLQKSPAAHYRHSSNADIRIKV